MAGASRSVSATWRVRARRGRRVGGVVTPRLMAWTHPPPRIRIRWVLVLAPRLVAPRLVALRLLVGRRRGDADRFLVGQVPPWCAATHWCRVVCPRGRCVGRGVLACRRVPRGRVGVVGGRIAMVEVVFTALGCLVAVTVGAGSTRGVSAPIGSGPVATPSPSGFPVSWDPSDRVLRRLGGPLVYVVREWDGSAPQPFVKIGWTGVTDPGAVARRLGDWETGSRFPLRVEGVIPSAPRSLEAALHRALGDSRTSRQREWFDAPYGETVWRDIVDATAAMHRPKHDEVTA